MSFAPSSLTELGRYWIAHGGAMLGIVGDAAHTTGYHLGKDRIYDGTGPGLGDDDYSVRLTRDSKGLTNAASAIDLGKLDGTYQRLYDFSRWLVTQCQNSAPGTIDIREIIYSPDGSKVQRYSGVDGKIHTGEGNGDASHRSHTHISYFRDSQNRAKVAVFAAYWEEEESGMEWRPAEQGRGVGVVTVKEGRGLVNLRTGKVEVPLDRVRNTFGRVHLAEPFGVGAGRQDGYLCSLGAEGHIALDDVVETFVPSEPGTGEPVTVLDAGLYRVS
jgi:hypothetical protein